MKVCIIQKGNSVLRDVSKAVSLKDIDTKKIQNIIKDMKETLASYEDGVAIAAPQISIPLRIFVVSGHIFDSEALENNDKSKKTKDLVFINPKITKQSKEKLSMPEGCLSVRHMYGDVKRSIKTTVRAYDEYGNLFTRGASGLLSQIFQHEIDHLDGIIFTDKAKNLEKILPKIEKNNEK